MIVRIGEWVLETAAAQAVAWRRQLPSSTPLSLSVNVSGRQLQTPELVGTVERIVEDKDATDDERGVSEINAGLYALDAAWLRRRIGDLKPSPATRHSPAA